MQSLRKILGEFIKVYGIESGTVLNALRRQWVEIVGQPVSVHTYPETIKGNILTVTVDTPQWMHHLSFFKEEITGKLASYNISDVRFRVGRLPEKTVSQSVEEDSELSDDDMRFIENTLKNVKDDEIKEKFRTLIKHGLTKKKK